MSENKELTVPERAAVALGAAEHEKALIELSTKYSDITKIVNPAGREQCHAAYMELKNARVAIANAGKTAREDANAFQKAVIAEVDRLTAITTAEEARLQALRDEWDAEREREKAAKAAAEAERIRSIKARIEGFMLDAVTASDLSAAEIDAHATRLSETPITLEEFCEFSGEAQLKRNDTVKWLRERQHQAAEREAEQARIAAEREALERQRAELAEQERKAAAARAEQEARDRAERERVAAEERAARQAEEARLKAEREAHEAELRKQREAEEARLAEQRAEFAREQDEMAERQRQLREATEKLAREQREREEAEAARIAAAAKLEADHAEGLIENARIDAERLAAFEAQQREAQRRADEAEQIRREHVQFLANGPGDAEIVEVLAAHYDVGQTFVVDWLAKFDAASFLTPYTEKAA